MDEFWKRYTFVQLFVYLYKYVFQMYFTFFHSKLHKIRSSNISPIKYRILVEHSRDLGAKTGPKMDKFGQRYTFVQLFLHLYKYVFQMYFSFSRAKLE